MIDNVTTSGGSSAKKVINADDLKQRIARFNSSEEPKPDLHQLKVEVNNLLFMCMPGSTTLTEMEAVSCAIVSVIIEAWEASS